MPQWEAKSAGGDAFLKYDLASPHALQYNKLDEDKTYLVWIMPKAGVVTAETTVYLGGKFDDATIQHPTPYFLTDYQRKTTVASLRNGQIRSLTAQATQRVKLPLEYITEEHKSCGPIYRAADVLSSPFGEVGLLAHLWIHGMKPSTRMLKRLLNGGDTLSRPIRVILEIQVCHLPS